MVYAPSVSAAVSSAAERGSVCMVPVSGRNVPEPRRSSYAVAPARWTNGIMAEAVMLFSRLVDSIHRGETGIAFSTSVRINEKAGQRYKAAVERS